MVSAFELQQVLFSLNYTDEFGAMGLDGNLGPEEARRYFVSMSWS